MNNLFRKIALSVMTAILTGSAFAVLPSIRNVSARQRHPWNGKVDIEYEVVGDIMTGLTAESAPGLVVLAEDVENGYVYPASKITGDTGIAEGVHKIVWDLDEQGFRIDLRKLKITVSYRTDTYCIIDLSSGANATIYPVSYRGTVPEGGWSDEYKREKIVFRRIESGVSRYGSGNNTATNEVPYYMGVFEITEGQYRRVVSSSSYSDSSFPVVFDICVAPPKESLLTSKLGERSGLMIALPTQIQWEYGCRAGTISKFNNGGDSSNSLDEIGRYQSNRSDGKGYYSYSDYRVQVGLYKPNGWGLYDMHGNVGEWCAPLNNSRYPWRGGSHASSYSGCASYSEMIAYSGESFSGGCRLVFPKTENSLSEICKGEVAQIVVQVPVANTIATTGTNLPDITAAPDWFGVDDAEEVSIEMDGNFLLSSAKYAWFSWQPQTTGTHTLTCTVAGTTIQSRTFTKTYNISEVEFENDHSAPNPPTAEDPNVWITSDTTSEFAINGGKRAINTGGTGTWTASSSVPWIVIGSATGSAGTAVMFQVNATTNVEERFGYIYVSGHTHLVKQAGYGATINPASSEFEADGGDGTIAVSATAGIAWKASADVPWISVSPTHGSGGGSVKYNVAPYNEVTTRSGTLTIAGKTFSVNQVGRRMKLNPTHTTVDYQIHVMPVEVRALASTVWNEIVPQSSWISVVDSGAGHGGGSFTISVGENPSYRSRSGTVVVGAEVFTVMQEGRTALEFTISPTEAEANWNGDGANGRIEVYATPDLPWTATNEVDWIEITPATRSGAGDGNVDYVLRKNWTLDDRVGAITLTAEDGSLPPRRHRVVQGASPVSVYPSFCEFNAAGSDVIEINVDVNDNVKWEILNDTPWLHISGVTNRMASGTVVLTADANSSIYSRSCQLTIAKQSISVSQQGLHVAASCADTVFGTEGGSGTINVSVDGDVSWTAVSSDATWLQFWGSASGVGSRNDLEFVVSPYVWDGTPRIGTITIGDEKIYITQRAYPCSIEPNGCIVPGNNGAGQFSVSASIEEVWQAIRTEDWITIIEGYDSGTGSGVVRFAYEDNNTGKMRTGKIIVNGEVYTLKQNARTMVTINASAGAGGSVAGGGAYDLGTTVTLTAVPDDGYIFACWTGAVESVENPLEITADVAKSLTALFEPAPIEILSVTSNEDGVTLKWNNLAWAQTYNVYRGSTSVPSSGTKIATLQNDGTCVYQDTTGDVETSYWYWVEAVGDDISRQSDPIQGKKKKPTVISPISYTNLRGATHSNPTTYTEGNSVTFSRPSAVTGYTFSGWQPAQITASMTGPQTIRATWSANTYAIKYSANGGSGSMSQTPATYDAEVTIPVNGFTWADHEFRGWSLSASGIVVYSEGDVVSNLTATANGIVILYAVWEEALVPPVITPADGAVFYGDSCEVTITCPTTGAAIYYTTNGSTPKTSSSYLYTGPFTITDTATIKAVAVKDGQKSGYSTATITKEVLSLTLEDALGVDDTVQIATGDTIVWAPILDETSPSGRSAKSGSIGDDSETWLQAGVSGVGTLSFLCKVSCEHDEDGAFTWDRLMVYVDGQERTAWRMDGQSGWVQRSVEFVTGGSHTVRWVYHKDESDFDGDDCVWLCRVQWDIPPDPIPVIKTDAEVAGALEGSADANLAAKLTNKNEYDAYRAWVDQRGFDHQTVKDAPKSWLSYALDTSSLINKRIKTSDLSIDSFLPYTSGGFMFKVSIDGVDIGDNASADNLAKVFGIEGANTLDGMFSSDNVSVSFGAPQDGKASVMAGPKDTAESFFMRATMTDFYGDIPVVSFSLNGGGSLNGSSSDKLVDCDSEYGDMPTPTRTGYSFAGWFTKATGGTKVTGSTTITTNGAHTLYAHWSANTYSVTFNPNGGSVSPTAKTVTYGSAYGTLPTPTREGHAFNGWFTDVVGGQQISSSDVVTATSNLPLYAHWTVGSCLIMFNANGGSVSPETQTVTYGDIYNTLPTPTKTGYSFVGWFTARDGGSQILPTDTVMVTGSQTVYAHWTPRSYTVTFDANEGVGSTTKTVTYATVVGELPSVTREGYVFNGWFTDPINGSVITSNTVVYGDRTYYAHWSDSSAAITSLYCVIDLSAGADAASYPVTYMDVPPAGGFNQDQYKTTKLVLRRIEPGTVRMTGETQSYGDVPMYTMTLTKPFYIGLFEVTQKQFELVTGSNPSMYAGDMRPVDNVSWNLIRGDSSVYNWPRSSVVDPDTFMGKIQIKTGLNFDLPTEAQWEYACRADTTSKYNDGSDTSANWSSLGRYGGNKTDGKGGFAEHTVVGMYQPNNWGVYDMHGNVFEWCLDWYAKLTRDATDPTGPQSGDYRVFRGGGWSSSYIYPSSTRAAIPPTGAGDTRGFRLSLTLN